jgi:hypothetical protein
MEQHGHKLLKKSAILVKVLMVQICKLIVSANNQHYADFFAI